MMIRAFYIGGFFSCILEIELQSTRVHMYEMKEKVLDDELPGWCRTLMDLGKLVTRLVIIFLFLVKTRGATLAEVCLRLEAD